MANSFYFSDLLYPDLVNLDRLLASAATLYRDKLGRFGKPKVQSIDQPSIAWQTQAYDWQIVRDLSGGTAGMRWARERLLPRFPKESDPEYLHRLEGSFLDEMFSDIIDETTAKPFSKPVSFSGDVPEWVKEFAKDVDGEGTSIHEFAKNHFRDALKWGKTHIAVDATGIPDVLPEKPQVRDFAGARARWRMVPGPNLLSWPRDVAAPGKPVREVRFYERVVDFDRILDVVHVWDAGQMSEYERSAETEAYPTTSMLTRRHYAQEIPFLTFYTKRVAELMSRPPFMDVAWINVDHWQSYSDQRQILHTARVPLLFRKGFTPDEIKKGPVVVGARRIHSTSNKDAEMRYVEPGGSSMDAGYKHLQMLKEDAKEKGSKPVKQKVQVTATGEIGADMKSSCDLQSWCEEDERVLRAAFVLTQKLLPWLDPIPDSFQVNIFSQFDLRDRSADEMSGLRLDRGRHDISRRTLWTESIRRGSLPEHFDMDAEEAALQKEMDDGMKADIAAAKELEGAGIDGTVGTFRGLQETVASVGAGVAGSGSPQGAGGGANDGQGGAPKGDPGARAKGKMAAQNGKLG